MSCINCDHSDETLFFSESFPCSCGDTVVISYHLCPECGAFWRDCNGQILDEVDVIDSPELADLFLGLEDTTTEELDAFLESLMPKEDPDKGVSMLDCVVKCLKCNAVAYEKSSGVYACSSCDFEWEVVDSA